MGNGMKHRKTTTLSVQLIREWFDVVDGVLVWKVTRGSGAFPGKKVGTPTNGRWQASVAGERIYVSNIVWCWHHGTWPQNVGMFVDHIDRDPSNNNIENLRLVSHSTNMKNTSRSISKEHEFSAFVNVNGFDIILGRFETLKEKNLAEFGATKVLEYLKSINVL